jgi:hypothetical protein
MPSLTTAPYIKSRVHLMINIFWGKKTAFAYFALFGTFCSLLMKSKKKLAGLAGLAGSVKLSRLRLRTESLVAKPAKPVAESNTSRKPPVSIEYP